MEDDCLLVLRVEMGLSNLRYLCIPLISDSEYKKSECNVHIFIPQL